MPAGAIAAWEAARLLKQLDLRPRRTVRVVLYTNEENGLRGGLDYRTRYQASLDRHVLMIESDLGVGATSGFGFSGNDTARAQVAAVASLLGPIGATHIGPSGGGADIGPSVAAARVPSMSPEVDSTKYFVRPPHRGRHGRPHRPDRPRQARRRAGRNDLRRGGHAGTAGRSVGHAVSTGIAVATE